MAAWRILVTLECASPRHALSTLKEHQAVLDTIDQKLLPAAKNPDVQAYLAEVRPMIAAHLQHAQDLQKALHK